MVDLKDQSFAIPTASVELVTSLDSVDVVPVPGGYAMILDERPIPLRRLASVLNVLSDHGEASKPVVVVRHGMTLVAFEVDSVQSEKEIVIKNFSAPLCSVPNVIGAALSGRGEVIVVLNPSELVEHALQVSGASAADSLNDHGRDEPAKKRVLVVDDSITTRTLESNILTMYGYEVKACVDGEDAWETLNAENGADAVEQTRLKKPDIVTMSIMDAGHVTKFILMTANMQQAVVDRAKGLGFIGFIEKPVTPDKVSQLLGDLNE